MLRRVAAFCRPLRPVLLLVSFPRSQSPVVGVLGLCWMWHPPPIKQRPDQGCNLSRCGAWVLFRPVVYLGKQTLPKGVLMPEKTCGPFCESCWVDRHRVVVFTRRPIVWAIGIRRLGIGTYRLSVGTCCLGTGTYLLRIGT